MSKKERQPRKKDSDEPSFVDAGVTLLVRLVRRVPPSVAVRAAICLLLFGFLAAALIHVDRHVKARPQFWLHEDSVKLPDLPVWCPPAIVRHFEEIAAGFRGCSIFERDLAERVAHSYLDDPWVRGVLCVRRAYPNTVLVSLDVRQPKYVIERPVRCPLVDAEGFVLPGYYQPQAGFALPLPFIRGVAGSPPPPGTRWANPALLGGIEVLAAIDADASPARLLPVTGADVANFGGRKDRRASDIVLITSRPNVTILWGRPPSTPGCNEATVSEKLAFIERWVRLNPSGRGDTSEPIALNARFAKAGGGVIVAEAGSR